MRNKSLWKGGSRVWWPDVRCIRLSIAVCICAARVSAKPPLCVLHGSIFRPRHPPPYPHNCTGFDQICATTEWRRSADPWDIREQHSPSIIIHLTRLLLCRGSIDRRYATPTRNQLIICSSGRYQKAPIARGGGIVKDLCHHHLPIKRRALE